MYNNIIYTKGNDDTDELIAPMLTIDNIEMCYFRGYFWTDTDLVANNEGRVDINNNSKLMKDPIGIVNSILKGRGISEKIFNQNDKEIINTWFKDSIDFFNKHHYFVDCEDV